MRFGAGVSAEMKEIIEAPLSFPFSSALLGAWEDGLRGSFALFEASPADILEAGPTIT